ncbi:ADP-ribosylglycohydrolase family protein [Streptomyces pilosus]|uniref:ADP-ribosylglycohydrolase family protein n=1 Tax=Streptomyces pilosus TaxID=28893 RepID=UPI0036842664
MQRIQRAAGAVVGSAVGDALGGAFKFGPQDAFSARFSAPGGGDEMRGGGDEMRGGGGRHPDQATELNGAVRPCLVSAAWALRTTNSFDDAIRAAIDLGGDTDIVAAVTGGLARPYYGLDAIPTRWTRPLHVPLPGFDGRVLHLAGLLHLTHRLLVEGPR